MGDVVNLIRSSPDVVAVLEQALAEAKAGEVSSALVVTTKSGANVNIRYANCSTMMASYMANIVAYDAAAQSFDGEEI